MTAAGVVARLSTFAAQVVIGWFLTPAQVGVYGTAVGVLSITSLVRFGGATNYLPTLRPDEFQAQASRLFAWALACAAVGTIATAAAAEPAADWYDEPVLAWVLYILAARHFVAVLGLLPRMKLVTDLRFKTLAGMDSVNAVVKMLLTCTMAVWLTHTPWAPLALVVPWGVSTLSEFLYCLVRSGITLREMTPQFRGLFATAHAMRWAFLFALLISVNSGTNFTLISFMLPIACVGIIYFAFQLSMQPMTLFYSALNSVFAPIAARHRHDPARRNEFMRSVCTGAMLFVPFAAFGACALFPAAESLIYRGRWEAAVIPFFALSVGTCYLTVSGILSGPLAGFRRFPALVGFEAARAVGYLVGPAMGYGVCLLLDLDLMQVPVPGAPLSGDLLLGTKIIAGAAGLAMTAVGAAQVVRVARHYGMPARDIAWTLVYGPSIALLTLIASVSLGDSAAHSLAPWITGHVPTQAIRLGVTAATFAFATIVCIRVVAESTLRQTVEILPPGIQTHARRALLLR
jgi:O-antigen/teichoic acid export membrane protein